MEPLVVVHANSIDNCHLPAPYFSETTTQHSDVAEGIALKVLEAVDKHRIVFLLEDYHSRGYSDCPHFSPLLHYPYVMLLKHPGNGNWNGGYTAQGIQLKLILIGMQAESVELAGYARHICVEDMLRLLESKCLADERLRYRKAVYNMKLPGIGMRVLFGHRIKVRVLEELCTD